MSGKSRESSAADLNKAAVTVGRLSERIEMLKARKARVAGAYRKRERARDTRRKIILGALIIASNTDPSTKGLPPAAWLEALDRRLTDPSTRELFGLRPLTAETRSDSATVSQLETGGNNE